MYMEISVINVLFNFNEIIIMKISIYFFFFILKMTIYQFLKK